MSHPISFAYVLVSVPSRGFETNDDVQVSVGIENISDIIADFEEALKVVP